MFFLFLVIQNIINSFVAFAQGLISQTEVVSFTRNVYGGGTQNWAIAKDKNNRIYVANNEGLLVYNGTNWQLHTVPNKTIIRSINFGVNGKLYDGKLYVGAQDELGYYAPDNVGRLQFTSLKNLLPQKDQKFADVWQVISIENDVFFRTDAKIFKFSNGIFTIYPTNTAWLSLHKYQGKLLAHDKALGLLIYENNQWLSFMPKDVLPYNFLITDLIQYAKDTSLISTTNGLYLLSKKELKPYILKLNTVNDNINKQHFTSLCALEDENSFLVGTYFNGIYKISKQGEILDNISTKNNIPNNTIRCLFVDTYKGIWAGLDNGIAFFTYQNAIKHINPPAFNNGVGYDAKILKDNLYFALSTGILSVPTQNIDVSKNISDLSIIAQEPKTILNGLTWNLSVVDNQILAGRDDGLFLIDNALNNQQITPISQSTGYWASLNLEKSLSKENISENTSKIIAGNYLGVHFFDKNLEAKNLVFAGKIENFGESSRYIESDAENIWVSHPYRGIYKIKILDKSVKLFSQKDGLPANLDNHVFKIKGQIIFATPKGIYEYDINSNKILKSKKYTEIFGQKPIRYIKEDAKGNLWFVQEKTLGVVDFSTGRPITHYIPELKNKIISGFENIFPHNAQNILIGGETGFYHLNYEKYLKNLKPFEVYVSSVKTSGIVDSVLFGGYAVGHKLEKNIHIPYRLNSLLFSYASSVLAQPYHVEYSHYLEGFDTHWSEWNYNTEKEYTNLPTGTYTFKLKARKSPSYESIISEFTFSISPPWYQSIWAYILYALLGIGFMGGVLKYQSLRHKKRLEKKRLDDLKIFEEEQKQQAYQHQLELAKSESEITHLRNEKLDAEIKHKNTELANTTMNLVQKKEFMLKLKKELQQLQKDINQKNVKAGDDNVELKKILKLLSEEEKVDDEWDNFTLHFNSVHGDFLTILKKKYPELTPHDLRLCAYLRMNLSSKEIMPLLGISLRGVEISRYRLRKKLALPTEANLVEYLSGFKDFQN